MAGRVPDEVGTEVVVVSGSYGAGHDAVADVLADQLRAVGHLVRRLDVAEELPWRLGALLRWLYFTQLRLLPASWGATVRRLERDGWACRGVRRGLGLLGRGLVRRVADSRLVVCTHPFAAQALGEARARGELRAPVVTYLTDASVQRLWVHPSVDLHLAFHELTADQARRLGGRVTVVAPLVSGPTPAPPGWTAPWPAGARAALLVGGSCGVGDLESSARDVLATGQLTPVVVCGTNHRLRRVLEAVPGVIALGWRDDMDALVRAAACVVQNAGGMTSLEAMATGTPTLTYRALPGHGAANARVLHEAGLVPWVTDEARLARVLARMRDRPRSTTLPIGAPSVLDVLTRAGLVSPALAVA